METMISKEPYQATFTDPDAQYNKKHACMNRHATIIKIHLLNENLLKTR